MTNGGFVVTVLNYDTHWYETISDQKHPVYLDRLWE